MSILTINRLVRGDWFAGQAPDHRHGNYGIVYGVEIMVREEGIVDAYGMMKQRYNKK